ncbi:hypothetical protein ASC66_16960 [Leifsonia sp. Root4]|uniref:SCO7613 C-terminal domain-containing membrane protein n=1 Tax=Leifsonia sp. Root4 TaxID=1736525 RepID=UPI0006FB5504|nr:hypothetical protein [Leifsonia sp. Root4]KQW03735.1 hypothetical protein ASC66_16960 [Leifsonia sp. Root4]
MTAGQGEPKVSAQLAWPRNTDELVNRALCPACFQTLRGVRCTVCGLDLSSPLAAELLHASTDAAELLNRRGRLIAQMREAVPVAAAVPAAVTGPVVVPAAAWIPPVAAPAPTFEAQPAAPPAAPPATPPLASRPAEPAAPRRSSVQMLLLVVGVSLVAVALVFFLIIAWFVAGLAFRAVIVAAITVLVFAAVSLLDRFRLHSTAEGVSVLAVLLVYLDIWAVQANDLFGAGGVDSAQYWGIAVLLSAPLLLGWFRFTGMRAASVAGFAAVPVGAGLLAWAVAAPSGQAIDPFQRPWLAAVVIVAAALVQLLAPRFGRSLAMPRALHAERVIVLTLAVPAVPAAVILGFFVAPGEHWAPLWGLGVPTVVFALHVLAGLRMPDALNRATGTVAAAAAGFSLAAMPIVIGIRVSTVSEPLGWSVLLSVAVLLAFDALRLRLHRAGTGAGVAASIGASIGAGVVVANALIVALGALLVTFVMRAPAVNGFGLWTPADPAALQPDVLAIQAALVFVGATVLATLTWAVLGVIRGRAVALHALVVLSTLGCAVLIPSPTVAALTYLAIAGCALAVLAVPSLRARLAAPGTRVLGVAALIVAASAGYTLAFDSLWLWLLASGVIISLLLGAREIAAVLRPVLLAAAVLVALGTTAIIPSAIVASAPGTEWARVVDTRALVMLVSGALLLLFSLPLGRFASPLDRAWALVPAAGVGVLASLTGSFSGGGGLLAPSLLACIGSAAAGIAAVLLIALPTNRDLTVTRMLALLGVTPAFWLSGQYAFAGLAAAGSPAPTMLVELWPAAVGFLALAISLARELRPATETRANRALDRVLLDASAGLVLLIGMVNALGVSGGPAAWLVYLVAGIAVLLASVDRSGLFNAANPRHHLGWLALVLGTAALWTGLWDAGVAAPEPYSIPLAAALLLIAALLVRAANSEGSGPAASTAVSALVAAGILIGLAPSAIYGANGSVLRPILTIALAGVILLAACLWRAPLPTTPLRLAVIAAAGASLLVAVGARALGLIGVSAGSVSGIFELWVLSGAGILIAAAAALGGESRRLSTALVATALVGSTLLEIAALTATADAAGAGVRAIAVIVALSGAHVLLVWLRPAALASWMPTLALGLAGASALYYLAAFVVGVDGAPPFEWAAVPIAAAWTASGVVRLRRNPATRSWPALGGGLALLLVPSLLADYSDSPLWRVVGLGVVGIAVLLIGLATRLQAPFVLGGLVVLLHGLAQLWPWLSSLYDPTAWWLWFGIGGILLIVVAARYEKRVQNVKDAVAMVGALR